MSSVIILKILEKLQNQECIEELAKKLTQAELSSLLMEVFSRKSTQITPASLLKRYRENRFSKPSEIDPLEYRSIEQEVLKLAYEKGYFALELSPLVPFGAVSAVAPVNQNNIVTALRSSEVTSDSTNSLALEAARRRKEDPENLVELCACQRVVRAQSFENPDHSAHFGLFAMVTAGYDQGQLTFEKKNMVKHIRFYLELLPKLIDNPRIAVTLFPVASKGESTRIFNSLEAHVRKAIPQIEITIGETIKQVNYYSFLRLNIDLIINDESHTIIDGGFTDWTQKLLGNRKERQLNTGMGLEYFLRIRKKAKL